MAVAASSMMFMACSKDDSNTPNAGNGSSGEYGYLYTFIGAPASDTLQLYDHYTQQGYEIVYDDKEDHTFLEITTESLRGKTMWSLNEEKTIISSLKKYVHINNWQDDFSVFKDSLIVIMKEAKAFAATRQPIRSTFQGSVTHETMDALINECRNSTPTDFDGESEWSFRYEFPDFVISGIFYKGSFERKIWMKSSK